MTTWLRSVPRGVGALLALGWMALIWTLSAQPPSDLSQGSRAGAWLFNLAHAPEYGALALWLALLVRPRGAPLADTPGAARAILVFALLHGVADEVHQSLVPGRDGSLCDVITDVVGAAALLAVVRVVQRESWGAPRTWRTVLAWAAACALAAAVATFVPGLRPELTWL